MKQTYWISRYALTKGIYSVEAEEERGGWIKPPSTPENPFPIYLKIGREAFLERYLAVDAARNLRDRKIASLKKQLQKLEALVFV